MEVSEFDIVACSPRPATVRGMRKLWICFVAAIALSSVAPMQAHAEVYTDNSTGGSNGNNDSSKVVRFECTRPALTGRVVTPNIASTGKVLYQWPYTVCNDEPTSIRSYSHWRGAPRALCTVGWEVWRFYGSVGAPQGAMSVSRINHNQNSGSNGGCMDGAPVNVISPQPQDVQGVSAGPFAVGDTSDLWGREVRTVGMGYTTATPFRHVGGSCAALQAPVAQIQKVIDEKREIFEQLQNRFEFGTESVAGVGADAAAAMMNGGIKASDGIDCNSGLDFVGFTGADRRIYGTCFIPIQRRLVHTYPSSAGSFEPDRVINNWTTVGGERYDVTKYSKTERGDFDRDWASQSVQIRSWIYDEVLNREGATLHPTPTTANTPLLVGEPYNGNWEANSSSTRNAAAAAAAARDHSRCEAGPFLAAFAGDKPNDVPSETPPPPPPPPPPVTVTPAGDIDVALDAPVRFFAGGITKPQSMTATPSPFTCDDCRVPASDGFPAGPSPILRDFNLELEVSATGGFNAWRETSRTQEPGILGAQRVNVEFYAGAANSNQQMVITAQAEGTYRVYPTRRIIEFPTGFDEQGEPLPPVYFPYYPGEDRAANVTFNPSQLTRDVVGATAAPR